MCLYPGRYHDEKACRKWSEGTYVRKHPGFSSAKSGPRCDLRLHFARVGLGHGSISECKTTLGKLLQDE
ncbi:hypothetical protein KIN20_016698 [Parelaphostrongylus tenuis]|uniref:Uncharacterized protein n=1 Tax=Parelaphostrongylus tenuis TaxID=148309 RepID=A0AAD5MYX3_PARTN|nr:hypothetical protein KIN20_016698 [Parelaphostrongylus tenuis]